MSRESEPAVGRNAPNEARSATASLKWLEAKPPLEEMRDRFPAEYREVEKEVAEALLERSPARLNRIIRLDETGGRGTRARIPIGRKRRSQFVEQLVKRRMAILMLERRAVAASTETPALSSRQGRLSRALTSGLFFEENGTKKPVSSRVFRWTWRFVGSKASFLSSMQSRGTYCFLSAELIDEIRRIVGQRFCVEIAAGDGTLSRFLRQKGVQIIATDDRSWEASVSYPNDVLGMEAVRALGKLAPKVVLCSWPPPGNVFEKAVFATDSVQTYLVIGSRLDFATGARSDYAAQKAFTMTRRPDLEALVLPPEIGTEVLLFERIKDGGAAGPDGRS